MLAARVAKAIASRRTKRADRKVGIVLFNFPPNAGNTGTAAFLSVFESLYRTLEALRREGYRVDLPAGVDELRERIIAGNAAQFGALANVHKRIPANDHVRRERLPEGNRGPVGSRTRASSKATGRRSSCWASASAMCSSGFSRRSGTRATRCACCSREAFAPTHAFSAFYRFLREDFGAHAMLHFGTHGALEFMPGKQSGMSGACWPDRLIGDVPNLYLYASNNPSEGTIAKRRSGATLISYLTPPVAAAGLYRGLVDLKESVESWRGAGTGRRAARFAGAAHSIAGGGARSGDSRHRLGRTTAAGEIEHLRQQILELEYTLIPHGLHVVGRVASARERVDFLIGHGGSLVRRGRPRRNGAPLEAVQALVEGATPGGGLAPGGFRAPPKPELALFRDLERANRMLGEDTEIDAIVHALDGGFLRPAPGGDVVRTPDVLPTGRNLHGFDPFRIPERFCLDGRRTPGSPTDRAPYGGRASLPRVDRVWSCGEPTI